MRVIACLRWSRFSRLRSAIPPRAAPRCEARFTPLATRRSRFVGSLGALAVVLIAGLVFSLTRSACADERSPADGHQYSLGECLALTERNHPVLAAARARLSMMRAQLDEARLAPAPLVALSSRFGVVPNTPAPTAGAPVVTSSNFVTQSLASGVGPFLQVGVSATLPLYTFGKISAANRAAEAQVRLGEWDVEKDRQQVRIDVRRAFYGVTVARDLLLLAVDDADRIRLEVNRDELVARIGEAKRIEA